VALDRLAALLAVARRVDEDPLALAVSGERGPVAQELDRVDDLAAAADDDSEVLALEATRDLLGVLLDLDPRLEVEGVGHALEDRPHALGGFGRQVGGVSG
jgi:hypothetical protein